LSALDALAIGATGTTLFILVRLTLSLATSSVCVTLLFAVSFESNNFGIGHILVCLAFLSTKGNGASLKGRLGHFLREGNLEHNVKVTVLVRLLVEGKTLVEDGLDVIGLDHLSGFVLNAKLGSIKVGDDEVNTSQSLEESDFLLHEQIGTLTLEALVGLFLDDNDDISGFTAGELISLTVESVLLVVGCTLVNSSLKDFLLLVNFLTIASFALVGLIDDLASSTAVITSTSGL